MKNRMKNLTVVGYIILICVLVTGFAIVANASAVWGN